MKILIIGIFSFLAWSALSTYLYVCKIKGFCDKPAAVQVDEVKQAGTIISDTVQKPQVLEETVIPKDLVIYFEFDKSEFISNSESDKYFEESNAYLNQHSDARLSIVGHTDAIGTNEYNQALGYRRAQRMQQYFESLGMLTNKIIIESKGENEPADDNNNKAGRANNRRAVITIKK